MISRLTIDYTKSTVSLYELMDQQINVERVSMQKHAWAYTVDVHRQSYNYYIEVVCWHMIY